MDICKNAAEYEKKLNRLQAEFVDKVGPKIHEIYIKQKDSLNNATEKEWKQLWQQYDKEISDLYHECIKPIESFIKSQPEKPIYIVKSNRRYYYLKINWVTGEYKKSKNPIASIQILRRKKPGWICEYTFPHTAFDFVICPNCKREFTRFKSHEKYCYSCRRSPRSKRPLTNQPDIRYCQNCKKPIPAGKNKRTKYCCGACRTAACEKRKNIIISPVPFRALPRPAFQPLPGLPL